MAWLAFFLGAGAKLKIYYSSPLLIAAIKPFSVSLFVGAVAGSFYRTTMAG